MRDFWPRFSMNCKGFLSAFFVAGWLIAGAAVCHAAPTVTMSVVDADVRDVLTGLAAIGRVNVVIDDSVTGRISVDFKNIPFDTALDIVTRSKGLGMYRNGGIIVFASQEKMEKGFGQVKVFPLKYARADHIKNIIVGGGKSDSEFAVENPGAASTSGSDSSGSGSLKGSAGGATTSSANKEGIKGLVVNTDASTNSLIVFGTPDQIEKVSQLLQELDVPYKQISLEAQVMALSKSTSKALGIDWTWSQFGASTTPETTTTSSATSGTTYDVGSDTRKNPSTWNAIGSTGTTTTTTTTTTAAATTSYPIFSVLGRNGLQYNFGVNATLNAAISKGDAKLLARPNILTFNGNKGTIFVGDQLPVVTASSSSGSTAPTYSTQYKSAGITLSYVPRINEEEQISASVFVEVSTPAVVTLYVAGEKSTAYQITTRSAQTNVRMKDGDTLVIGGLMTSSDIKSLTKVPFLGDLPVLGQFFRSLSKSKEEVEVVIFLKAKIVK